MGSTARRILLSIIPLIPALLALLISWCYLLIRLGTSIGIGLSAGILSYAVAGFYLRLKSQEKQRDNNEKLEQILEQKLDEERGAPSSPEQANLTDYDNGNDRQ